MTKSELVQAYLRGEVDRRGFIRKLSAVGVSSGAAAVYATSLAHPAAVAADRNAAGFIAGVQPDEDYGLAVALENIIAALQRVADVLRRLIARLQQVLSSFGSANSFLGARQQDDQMPVLEEIRSQASDHIDALSAMFPELDVTPLGPSVLEPTDTDEALVEIADDYNTLAGVYAALLPNLEDLEQRQTMTEIAIVGGRHAGLVSHFAGLNPVPAAFEQPIDPASVS